MGSVAGIREADVGRDLGGHALRCDDETPRPSSTVRTCSSPLSPSPRKEKVSSEMATRMVGPLAPVVRSKEAKAETLWPPIPIVR